MVCCFFGHHNAPAAVKVDLLECIKNQIENENVDSFLVGNHGSFDGMVLSALRKAKAAYPHITYSVVLAYMPDEKVEYSYVDPMETVYPEGLESLPKRFAISWRNDWMLKQSDVVVCYVWHSFGGSSKFAEKASNQSGK